MSRFLFFTQEAFRALRRNGAPSMAAIVTTVTTVILLGVLIPVFQTAQAKSDQVRESLEFRVAVYDDALDHERPADEPAGRADQPHHLDLAAAGVDREPDRVADQHQRGEDQQRGDHG